MTNGEKSREERLAEALRENLKRRKRQSREMGDERTSKNGDED